MATSRNRGSRPFKVVTNAVVFSNPTYKMGSTSNGVGTPTRQRKRRARKMLSLEMFKRSRDCDSQEFKLPHELAAEGCLDELKAAIEEYSLTMKETDEKGGTLLHAATHTNQLQVMQYLIESGIDLNAADEDGNTALHIAVMNGHIEALHLLLNSGASDTILNNDQDAALHIIVRGTNTNLLLAFLEHPFVDLAVEGFRQRTPLHVIAEHDNIEALKILGNIVDERFSSPKYKFRVCSKDEDNLTPIHLAARQGSHRVLDVMISVAVQHGYTVEAVLSFLDEENCTPLYAAVDGGYLEVVRVLLKYGSDPTVSKEGQPPPLHIACAQGKIAIVQAMVECCGNSIIHINDQYGRSPLHFCASAINGAGIIAYLIQKGIAINSQDKHGRTSLHNAITTGSLAVVKELLSSGINPLAKDENGLNPLHDAVIHNRKAIINLLLNLPSAPQLVSDTNSKLESPVHLALKMGLGEVVAPMASVVQYQLGNTTDSDGSNYLHLAAAAGDWKALSILLGIAASQTQLNGITKCGATPLHVAAFSGSIRCCEILLSHGAMSHKCHSGFTPFLVACQKGHKECAKILYEAHPYQKDWTEDKGNTALHMAAKSGNPSMVNLILDTGVEVTHNFSHISFLDQIIENMDVKCAMAVVKHSRWQECLDLRSPFRPHPMVGLIVHMPEVAQVVLDRCHTKANLDSENKGYWEKYDFKYLRLTCEDLNNSSIDPNDHPDKINPLLEYPDEVENPLIRYKRSSVSPDLQISPTKKTCSSTAVLQKMVHHKRVGLLTHPVVEAFLHLKWRTYGRPLFVILYLVMALQSLFLTTYIVLVAPHSSSVPTTNDTASNSTNMTALNTAPVLGIRENTIRYTAIILTMLSSLEIFKTGWRLLRTPVSGLNSMITGWFWIQVIVVICSSIFLLPSEPIWEVGALAGFSTWFRVAWGLQYFGVFGIYITMFITITKTAVNVILVASLVLFAFATALYALLASVPQFSSVGNAIFSTFGYMLGEVNYDLFTNGDIPHRILTLLFMSLVAVLLTIVMANLMIGLAVGDIEKVRFNATVEKRAIEVHYFATVDSDMPKRLLQRFNKPYYIKFPNGRNSLVSTILQYVIRYTTSGNSHSSKQEDRENRHTLTVEEHAQELAILRQQLDGLTDMMKQLLKANQQEQYQAAKRNHELPI